MTRSTYYQIVVAVVILVLGGLWFITTSEHLTQFVHLVINKSHPMQEIYYCPMHPSYVSPEPGNCPICGMNLTKRSGTDLSKVSPVSTKTPRVFTVQELLQMKPGEICLLHKCNKHCSIAMTEEFARLGKCPHCGENLGIIVKDLIPKGYGNVSIGSEKQQLIGIKTAPSQIKKFTKTIRATGKIAYDPGLYQAEQEYLQAAEAFKKTAQSSVAEIKEQAAQLVESSRIKLKLLGLNDTLIQSLEKQGKADRSLLYSEADQPVWVYVNIYEYEIPLIKIGDKLKIQVPTVTGKEFEGTVRAIDTVVNPFTRSVRVRATLDNVGGLLKPDMYVNAFIQIDLGDVLTVPTAAVFATGEKNIIFVAKNDGRFEPREVSLGARTEELQEIKSGISEGEKVVVSGNFLIDSESQLKAALETISSPENPSQSRNATEAPAVSESESKTEIPVPAESHYHGG